MIAFTVQNNQFLINSQTHRSVWKKSCPVSIRNMINGKILAQQAQTKPIIKAFVQPLFLKLNPNNFFEISP
jgi:hypothetical protein